MARTPRPWKGLHTSDAWQDKFHADGIETTEAQFWGLVP